MTAQLKRFPAKRAPLTPQQIKVGEASERLRALARKADLLAYTLQGVMALEETDAAWPLQDAVYSIKDEIEAIAEEMRL